VATKQTTKSAQAEKDDFNAKFELALDRKRLRKPAPARVQGTRSQAEPVFSEDELNRQSRDFFVETEQQLAFYSERLGHDVMWLQDWLKKWWWAWLVRDMDMVNQLCTADVTYKDPVSFGRQLVGLKEFVDYNDAFFDAIPDWRYDPLPGQIYINVEPDGGVRMAARYIGTGHWDHPLRMYPFDRSAAALPATGAFMQAPAVDRYHFNADGMLFHGETLWDAFEGMQMSGVLPSDDSLAFKALMQAAGVGAFATRVRRRLPIVGG
jgi:hypothetical protein